MKPTVVGVLVSMLSGPLGPIALAFDSGGLGVSRDLWESAYGTPVACPRTGYDTYQCYQSGTFMVRYDVAYTRVTDIYVGEFGGIGESGGMTLKHSRKVAERLIPADARHIETYQPPDGSDSIVDLFMSESLQRRFPETVKLGKRTFDTWLGGEPGNFIIIYSGGVPVERIVIAIGNNP